jgi:hypothetical protein
MKRWSIYLIPLSLLFLPVLTQAQEEINVEKAEESVEEVHELKRVSKLPEVVKDARDANTEEDEIQKVVRGVKDDKLTTEEGIVAVKTMEENTRAGKSNNGISEFVFQQKQKGLKGRELGQAIKNELQRRHRIRKTGKEEKKEIKEDKQKKILQVDKPKTKFKKKVEVKEEAIKKAKEKQKNKEEDTKTEEKVKTHKKGKTGPEGKGDTKK